jgi:fatty-acyl-CoA synthase
MTAQQTTSSGAESSQAVTRQGSYTSGTSDIPLLGMTIGDLFDQTVETYPDHLALVSRAQQIRLSYRELQQQVNQCARGLMHLGLQKGERIGIWAPNRAEWCVTQFATSKLGLILVNINPAYRVHELEYALNQSGCSALVLAPTFKSSNYAEMLTSLAPELKDCEAGQLQSAKLPRLRTVICLGEERHPGMYSWGDLMTKGEAVRQEQLNERQREQEFDDPINIQYTS